MKAAIMQPYFMPYLGYYQLMRMVDVFVIYDNIKYTKKGWINRNRYLANGHEKKFSLPLRSDSDYLDIVDRELADSYDPMKLLNGISEAYRKAPLYQSVMPVLEDIFRHPDRNLFSYLHHSLARMGAYLGIKTPIVVSSKVEADHTLGGEQRVIDICQALRADTYVNPPGGRMLYSSDHFSEHGLRLQFIEPQLEPYPQAGASFVPGLSIIDVVMNNEPERLDALLSCYTLSDI